MRLTRNVLLNEFLAIGALLSVLTGCGGGGGASMPPPPTFAIGGTVTGLSGAGLVLRNNGAESLSVPTAGTFTFVTAVNAGATYSVTVATHPAGQQCAVANGSGTARARITNVAVTCTNAAPPPPPPGTFGIGGTVSGLTGAGLVLVNNGGNDLAVAGNGAFAFSTRLASAAAYSVTVATQPSGQTCSLGNAAGTVAAEVTNISVVCAGSAPSAQTGVFIGPVQGLRYRTASGSGLTDSNGRFSYLPGETVTFSIGGIELGAARGAPRVSLFSLFDLTPPATEAAVRAELAREHDITDFDRVANIAWLLTALDRDANPVNGLDLSDRDAALAGVTLSFELPLYDFPTGKFEVFAREHGANRNTPITTPLVQLYRALGIAVPAHALSRDDFDNAQDGAVESLRRYEYDSRGRVTLVTYASGSDLSVGRQFSRYGYDDADRPVSAILEYDDAGDGALEYRSRETATYDGTGNLLTDITETDNGANGSVERTSQVAYTFDTRGNRLTMDALYDINPAGVPDRRSNQRSTYDANNRVISETYESDRGAGTPLTLRVVRTIQYDARGNLSSIVEQQDGDGAGPAVQTALLTSRQYDTGDHLVREEIGPFGLTAPHDTDLSVFTRDANGRIVVRDRSIFAPTGIGVPRVLKSRRTTTNSYDSNSNVLVSLQEFDDNGNGGVDRSFRRTYTYDASGRELARQGEGFDSTGAQLDLTTDLNTFSSEGIPLTSSERVMIDGALEESGVTRYFHETVMPDGLLYLISVRGGR